ncbi:MAG: hypothetical protein M0Q23_08165 [Syntrophales bacterium]|nr:hypothetical protein [Syntrophales bacterium]MDX9922765.1 hypothetical protein [Syntrophales bacterium]
MIGSGMDLNQNNLKSSDNLKILLPVVGHLFWWVPREDRAGLSVEAVVEAVLSNGDEEMIRLLFNTVGVDTVADIFYRQVSGQRTNYRPRTINFFRLYFQRHAKRNTESGSD